jgi:hypothetical protein
MFSPTITSSGSKDMHPFLKSFIAGIALSFSPNLFAQGQAVPIYICLNPEMVTNSRGKQVLQEIDNGDKIKGYLYQSKQSGLRCTQVQNPDFPEKVYPVTLKIHGQSSQTYNQKSYTLEFYDKDYKALAKEQQINFAGLPKGENFVLTSNYVDRSDMRNPLAFSLAKQLGQGRPDANGKGDYMGTIWTFAQVSVNSSYEGLYTLSARVERGKERLDIAKVDEDHYEDFDWIGEICTGVKDADYHSQKKTFIKFRYPETKSLSKFNDKDKGEAAKQVMINDIEKFETMLASPGFKDPNTGYASAIDVSNFVDFIILQEVAKNVDGLRRSVWFRHVGGKFAMGPVWDFDGGFGNLNMYGMNSTSGWLLDFGQDKWYSKGGLEQFPAAFWFRRLIEDPAFADKVRSRYYAYRMPGGILTDANIDKLIGSFKKDIGSAGKLNEDRWAHTRINPLHTLIFNASPFHRGYEDNVGILTSWVKERLKWMDKNMASIERRK